MRFDKEFLSEWQGLCKLARRQMHVTNFGCKKLGEMGVYLAHLIKLKQDRDASGTKHLAPNI